MEWREWVEEDTCLANDEDGRRKCAAVNAYDDQRNEGKRAKGGGAKGGAAAAAAGSASASGLDTAQELVSRETLPVAPGRVRIEVPPELKAVLVEDWEAVVGRKCLLRMPCAPEHTVAGLVERYLAFLAGGEAPAPPALQQPAASKPKAARKPGAAAAAAAAAPAEEAAAAAASAGAGAGAGGARAGAKRPRAGPASAAARPPEELCAIRRLLEALLAFFDKKMAVACLYRFELMQYQAWCREPATAAAVSGANADDLKMPQHPHSRHWPAQVLLRLLVLLPDIFHSERSVTPPDAEFINTTLGDFLKWLARHSRALFSAAEHYARAAGVYAAEYRKTLEKGGRLYLYKMELGKCCE